ncbi:MAG: DUF72 domain-containing protein [Desulfobacterales bacterium]
MTTSALPHAGLLSERAQQLIQVLNRAGLQANLVADSLRTYSIKIALGPAGRLNLYYSPKKKRFRLGGHELKDPNLWSAITLLWDGDLGRAPLDASAGSAPQAAPAPSERKISTPTAYTAYVDGSYIKGRIGYGALILKNGTLVWEGCGRVPAQMAGMRQVGGELSGVMEVVRWCQAHQVAAIAIYYDYAGIAAWPTGRWQAKLPATQAYRDFIRTCGVALSWHKVKSHSGDRWNEQADRLARQGTDQPPQPSGPPTDAAKPTEPATPARSKPSSAAKPAQTETEDAAEGPRFRFRDLHPDLFLGTASDRYAGWLGQIYSREKYATELAERVKRVAGQTYREQVLPVTSVGDYFRHFRILEIDFTFYQPLLDSTGRPTRAHGVLRRYLDHLAPADRLLLKVPQSVTAPELYRAQSMVANAAYLDARQFDQGFYAPAMALCEEHLWGFVFEQGYMPKARRQAPEKLAAGFDAFFDQAPRDSRYHLELRTPFYLAPPLFEVLARHGVGQVFSHWTWLPDLKTQFEKGGRQFYNAARQAVVRLITPRGMRYADSYHKAQPFNQLIPGMLDEAMLDDTAELVQAALNQAYTLALIINNRAGGNAPLIAEALSRRIETLLPPDSTTKG